MVVYTCPRCYYETNRKHDMEKHKNKKNICQQKYKCSHCDFNTFNKTLYDEHINSCSLKILSDIKIEQEKQKLINLKFKNQKISQKFIQNNQTNNQTNNQNINNTDNSVNNNTSIQFILNAWTNPDLSHMTDVDYYDCISAGEDSVLKFTKMVYFDPKVPQNHSIFLDDKRLLAYKDNNTWCPKERDDFVEDLIDNNDRYMDTWSIDNEDNEKFKDARKLYIETRKIIGDNIDDIKSDLLDEFYANKKMVFTTTKLLK